MIKKRVTTKAAAERSVTAERARRLHQLLNLLSGPPQTRSLLTKRLKLDIRGFYRDLEVLRESGIQVNMNALKYVLDLDFKRAANLLPFPPPHLTLAEPTLSVTGTRNATRKPRNQLI